MRVIAAAAGAGGGAPVPLRLTDVDVAPVALLVMVTVPIDPEIAVGANVTVNDSEVFGARLNGSDGTLFKMNGAGGFEIPVTLRFVVPVLVIVTVAFDDELMVTLPKLIAVGETEIAGWLRGGANTEKAENGLKLT